MRKRDGSEPEALSAEDRALFAEATRDVRAIRYADRVAQPRLPILPAELLRERRYRATGADAPALPRLADFGRGPALAGAAPEGAYLRTGCGPDLLRRLRRGRWPTELVLDLHHATTDEAHVKLEAFLRACLNRGVRCVRIVHGKGYGSPGARPVLKNAVGSWLRQLAAVLAYVECPEHEGGAGALRVLLESPRTRRA